MTAIERLKRKNEKLKWQVANWERKEIERSSCCIQNEEGVKNLTTALKELRGFAQRNLERAKKAHLAAKKACVKGARWNVEVRMQEAREHEALRFFNVVRDRVEEALLRLLRGGRSST